METKSGKVKSLELDALSDDACRSIFENIGNFTGTDAEWRLLAQKYNGNPLALNLLARHINEVYFGNISEFLKSGDLLFGELNELVKWHINRLSDYQREILFWIAIYREPVSSNDIKDSIFVLIHKVWCQKPHKAGQNHQLHPFLLQDGADILLCLFPLPLEIGDIVGLYTQVLCPLESIGILAVADHAFKIVPCPCKLFCYSLEVGAVAGDQYSKISH